MRTLLACLVALMATFMLSACGSNNTPIPAESVQAVPAEPAQMVYVLEPEFEFLEYRGIVPTPAEPGSENAQWGIVYDIKTVEGVFFTGWDLTDDRQVNPTAFHVNGLSSESIWDNKDPLHLNTSAWGSYVIRSGPVFDDLVTVCGSKHRPGEFGIIQVEAPPALTEEIQAFYQSACLNKH